MGGPDRAQAHNEKYLVTNPAVGLTSAIQARRGAGGAQMMDEINESYQRSLR